MLLHLDLSIDHLAGKNLATIERVVQAFIDRRLADQQQVREVLLDDDQKLAVFAMDRLMSLSFVSLGATPQDRTFVLGYAKGEAGKEAIAKALAAVGEIVLGIAEAIFGGPFGALVAVASLTKSLVDLHEQVRTYEHADAAYQLDLASEAPSKIWIAIAAAAVVIDAASVGAVMRSLGAFDAGKLTAHELREQLEAIETLGAHEVDELLAHASTRARGKVAISRAEKLHIDPSDADPELKQWLSSLKDPRTLEDLPPRVAEVLVHMDPAARRLLTKCASDCLPPWLKEAGGPQLVARVEALEKAADREAFEALRDLLHEVKTVDEAIAAIRALEGVEPSELATTARALRGGKAVPAAEGGEGTIRVAAEARQRVLVLHDFVPPPGSGRRSGHARSGHGWKVDDPTVLGIRNAPDKLYVGVNKNGNPVVVFWKNGNVVITDAADTTAVITAYGQNAPKRASFAPDKWANDPNFYEVK